eukprot:15450379-Alexandrium_andersonii.AAC.1
MSASLVGSEMCIRDREQVVAGELPVAAEDIPAEGYGLARESWRAGPCAGVPRAPPGGTKSHRRTVSSFRRLGGMTLEPEAAAEGSG